MRGQVAALGVGHALAGILGDGALVDVLAVEAVALVPVVARAEEAPEGVGAVAEDVARAVLALVVVGHVAALAAVAVVAVALGVQARAVAAVAAGRVQAVIWRERGEIEKERKGSNARRILKKMIMGKL